MNYLKLSILSCFVVLGICSSCKKTEALPALPGNRILEYKIVPNPGDTLLAAIDEVDKTVTVYLPFYFQLTAIDPIIKLSEGARLKEESLPIDVLSENTSYQVLGSDNTSSTYQLKIVIQQLGPLNVKEVSNPTNPLQWGIGQTGIILSGNFNTTNPALIRPYLVDAAGKETELIKSGTAPISISGSESTKLYTYSGIGVPSSIEPGSYRVRVKVLKLTTDLQHPVTILYKQPEIAYTSTTVKQGDTFTIKSVGNVFHKFTAFYIMVAGVKTLLPIEKYTRTEATIRMPESVPTGNYLPKAVFEGFPEISIFWQLTVNPK